VEKAEIDGRYFTLLRNPLDRLITDFFWNVGHQQGMSAYKAMGLFTEFVNSNDHLEFYIHHCGPLNFNNAQHFRADECSTVSNVEADVMARERLERCFWLVGITELFEQSLFLVAEAVGVTKVHHWWKRSQPKTRFRPQFMDFPKSLRSQIERKTAFDMALYEFYRSKFESKFKVEQFGDSFVNHFNEAHPCSMR
jgi:hypothetical protein